MKVLKYMLLVTGLTSDTFSVVTCVVVPSLKLLFTSSNMLLRANLASNAFRFNQAYDLFYRSYVQL